MGNFGFNISKGRELEFHTRVDNNDPAPSALILVVLREAGIESDDILKDYDTLSAILAGASDEATNTNYARKTLTDADISAVTVDDTNDRVTATFSNQTYTSVGSGDSWRKLLVCYDADTAAGTDANITPIAAYDLLINGAAVVPNGTNIVISAPNGYALIT